VGNQDEILSVKDRKERSRVKRRKERCPRVTLIYSGMSPKLDRAG